MTAAALTAFAQVIAVDVVLSGDNAVVIGVLASALPASQRGKAILWGMVAAVLMRAALSLSVFWLLRIPGVMFAGGAMLVWIAAKMAGDIKSGGSADSCSPAHGGLRKAIFAICAADLSMSIDNVLGVAGAARNHPEAMVFGLVLSMALMAFGAAAIAKLIERRKWIAWVGFWLILFVAVRMLVEGVLSFSHWLAA